MESFSLKPAVTGTNPNRTYQMTAVVEPADVYETVMKDIRWSSSSEEIAKVDQNGRVTTCSPGSCYIRAELGGIAAEYQVRVIEARPLEIRVQADGYEKVIDLAGKDNLTGKDFFEF